MGHRTRSVLCCAFDSLRLGAVPGATGQPSSSSAGAAAGGAVPAWSVAAPSLLAVSEGGIDGRLASATRALARAHGVPAIREFESHGGRRWAAQGSVAGAGQSAGEQEAKGSDAEPGPGAGDSDSAAAAGLDGARVGEEDVRDPGRYAQRARLAEPLI